MARKRFFVTGASGFVGMEMVKHLLSKGHEVLAGDLEGTDGDRFRPLGVEFAAVDVTRKRTLEGILKGVDTVMHIAAVFDISAPWELVKGVNVGGTRNVAEAAVEAGVKRLVYFSSADVYGDPSELPATETCKIRPNHDYGESKFQGEREALRVARETKLEVTILRPAAQYGPGSTYGMMMLFDLLARGVLPGIPGDGRTMVHLVHIGDVVAAGEFLATKKEAAGKVYNLADDTPMPLGEMIEIAAEALEVLTPKAHLPRVALEAAVPLAEAVASLTKTKPILKADLLSLLLSNHIFDNSRIKKLGYTLHRPDVREGLRETLGGMEKGVMWKVNHAVRDLIPAALR